jgi:hypothetical protein
MTCPSQRGSTRLRSCCLAGGVLGAVLASACGGASDNSLSSPPRSSSSRDSGVAVPVADAGGSPLDPPDATVIDAESGEAAAGDDVAEDAALDAGPAVEAGSDAGDASVCSPCLGFGQKCCETPGAFSYGQCYSPALCAGCCF